MLHTTTTGSHFLHPSLHIISIVQVKHAHTLHAHEGGPDIAIECPVHTMTAFMWWLVVVQTKIRSENYYYIHATLGERYYWINHINHGYEQLRRKTTIKRIKCDKRTYSNVWQKNILDQSCLDSTNMRDMDQKDDGSADARQIQTPLIAHN